MTASCWSTHGCLKLNSGPLEEQETFLMGEQNLPPKTTLIILDNTHCVSVCLCVGMYLWRTDVDGCRVHSVLISETGSLTEPEAHYRKELTIVV